jgi:hypothetical protein
VHGAGGEGVGLGAAAELLVCGAEAADERVAAAPGLAQRARAGRRRALGLAEVCAGAALAGLEAGPPPAGGWGTGDFREEGTSAACAWRLERGGF